MRYLKTPNAKRADQTIPWKQEGFTNIYRDIPATEVPPGGLVNTENLLLYGSTAQVRSGDEIHVATALPTDATQPFSSGIAKSATSVTHSGNGFVAADVGKYLIWDDNTTSMIVVFVGAGEVTVDDSTAQSDTDVTIRSQIWGHIWHEKSRKIFMHIGTRLFHTPWNFSGGWVEINLPNGTTLGQTRSEFDKNENLVYVYNGSSMIMIDVTDTTDIQAIQINMASPPNTITPMTDEKDDADAASAYPPTATEAENKHNKFGRRYLFSMVKLDGLGTNDRGDGTRLVKESSTNTFPASNDFKDFKESWRLHNFDNADSDSVTRTYSIGELDVRESTSHLLLNFINTQIGVVGVTIESDFRDVQFDFEGLKNWDEIAEEIGNSIRSVFTEYPSIHCTYKKTGYILIASGDPSIDVQGLTSPAGSGFDFAQSGFFDTYLDKFVPSWRAIGTKAIPALQTPSGQYGYTHFGVYSTNTLGPDSRVDQNNIINPEYFIWQKDIPIIKTFMGITTDNTIYTLEDNLLKEDVGSWFYHSDGTKEQFAGRVTSHEGLVYNDGTALKINYSSSGSNTTATSFKLIASGATFSSDGIVAGDMVVNITDTDSPRATVVSVDSETQLTLDTDIFLSTSESYFVGGGQLSIGSAESIRATKSGTTVTKAFPASGTYDFVAADIGKTIFWADGTFDIIISITSVTVVETAASSTISVAMAMAFEPNGRNYNDALTDIVLEDRKAAYPVLSRFYTALPNSDLGAIIKGFMVVATDGETKGYYSQYSDAYKYLAGHHYEEHQHFVVPDIIKELQMMPNQLIVWCKSQTWRFQTNVIDNVQDARVGESIAILSGQSVVDENIGISDRQGIVSYGNGLKLVITSEPGLRVFDSYKYSPQNKLMDHLGNGHIKKDFQILKDRIVAYYEPNMYGVMFWGSTLTDVDGNGDPLLSKSNKCYRMAVEAQHGFGFSELNGTKWNYIELNSRPMLISDTKGNKFTILFDTNLGYPHRLSTRKLSDTGASSEIELNFKDNEDVGGGNGTEITWKGLLREHVAPEEQWTLRDEESYWYLRPHNESNKDASGYDEYGFRDEQKLTFKVFVDGNTTAISQAITVDPKATIYQPYRIEDRRIQIEISGTASELILTGMRSRYDVLKRRVPPGSQDETAQQEALALVLFWLTRGYYKMRDKATGNDETGSAGRFREFTGPDALALSAFNVVNTVSLSSFYSYAAPATSTTRTILVSLYSPHATNTGNYYEEYVDGVSAKLKIDTGDSQIVFNYNNVTELAVTISTSTWYTFKIVISPTLLSVFHSKAGATVTTETPQSITSSALATTDTIRLGEDLAKSTSAFYDLRIIDGDTIDADAFAYYLRDIYSYEGFSLLPHNESGLGESVPV